MEKLLLKIIRFFVCLSLFTPLVVSDKLFFPYVSPKSIFFLICSEVVIFSYLLLNLYSSKYRPKINLLSLTVALFLVILILSSYLGIDFENSFWSKYERMTGLLAFFHFFGFFLVLISVFKKREDWLKIFGISVSVAVMISICSIIEKMGVSFIGVNSRGGFTLGNSSFLGTYLLFNFFFALYLFFKTNPEKFQFNYSKVLNFLSLLSIGLIGLALWFSEARAALFCTFGGLFVFSILCLSFSKKKILKYIGIFTIIIGIIAVLYVVFLSFNNSALIEEKILEHVNSSAVRPRFATYDMSLQALRERPFLGWGLGNFGTIFTKYFSSEFFTEAFGADIWYDKAHNIIFDTLGESGLFGLLSYIFIFMCIFYVLWKEYFKEKIDVWTIAVFSALPIAYFVQNLTVFDMISSYLMWFLVLGFIGSIDEPIIIFSEEKNIRFKPFFSLVILLSFGFSFFFFIVQPARKGSFVIKAASSTPFSDERFSAYQKAVSISPLGQDQVREFLADSTVKFTEHENISKVPEENVIRELDFVCKEIEKSIERNPLNYRLVLKLGKVYNTYFRFDKSKVTEAEEFLERAIELSPNNQQTYWSLAQTKLFQNKIYEALALSEKAVELEPNAERSHLVLIQVARTTGDFNIIKEKVENALAINSAWAEDIKAALGIPSEESTE